MNQHTEIALIADEWGLPPVARLVALILLVVFAVLTVALVPLEYRFFRRVSRRALPWMLGLELIAVVAIVVAELGKHPIDGLYVVEILIHSYVIMSFQKAISFFTPEVSSS